MKKNPKREGEEQAIGPLMEIFLQRFGLKQGLDTYQIESAWEEIMGAPIARYTRTTRYRDGVLYVELESDALRNELQYGLSRILEDFQNKFGKDKVREIVLR